MAVQCHPARKGGSKHDGTGRQGSPKATGGERGGGVSRHKEIVCINPKH